MFTKLPLTIKLHKHNTSSLCSYFSTNYYPTH